MSIYQNSLSLRPGPWPGSTRCNEDNSSWLPHTAPTDQTQVISAGQCNNVSRITTLGYIISLGQIGHISRQITHHPGLSWPTWTQQQEDPGSQTQG